MTSRCGNAQCRSGLARDDGNRRPSAQIFTGAHAEISSSYSLPATAEAAADYLAGLLMVVMAMWVSLWFAAFS